MSKWPRCRKYVALADAMDVDLLPVSASRCQVPGTDESSAIETGCGGIVRYAAVSRQSAKPQMLQISRTENREVRTGVMRNNIK